MKLTALRKLVPRTYRIFCHPEPPSLTPYIHFSFQPHTGQPAEPTHWAFIARENGALEIYSMPEFKISFLVKNFSLKPKVLIDHNTLASGPYNEYWARCLIDSWHGNINKCSVLGLVGLNPQDLNDL